MELLFFLLFLIFIKKRFMKFSINFKKWRAISKQKITTYKLFDLLSITDNLMLNFLIKIKRLSWPKSTDKL
jgi:hypothetical protein